MRRTVPLAAALAVCATIAGAQAYDPMRPAANPLNPMLQAAPQAEVALDPDFGLPAGDGMEDTYYQCSACHSTSIIVQQRLTDARWDYLWDWMIEKQGMQDTDAETREIIMAYLQEHFSSER